MMNKLSFFPIQTLFCTWIEHQGSSHGLWRAIHKKRHWCVLWMCPHWEQQVSCQVLRRYDHWKAERRTVIKYIKYTKHTCTISILIFKDIIAIENNLPLGWTLKSTPNSTGESQGQDIMCNILHQIWHILTILSNQLLVVRTEWKRLIKKWVESMNSIHQWHQLWWT